MKGGTILYKLILGDGWSFSLEYGEPVKILHEGKTWSEGSIFYKSHSDFRKWRRGVLCLPLPEGICLIFL